MFKPRRIEYLTSWEDPDRIKIYTISADGCTVDIDDFLPRFHAVKLAREVDWEATPAFAIFHSGASMPYLVLAWWQNENELLTSVSVREQGEWIEDGEKYSFCIWDLAVIWYERNAFIEHLYSGRYDLDAYRKDRYGGEYDDEL